MEAFGVDVDADAVAVARERGLTVVAPEQIDTTVPDESVQMGTLWDVIEHVEQPDELVHQLLQEVGTGGLILLETPDARFALRPVARWLHHLSSGRIRLVRRLYYSEHRSTSPSRA